MTRREKIENLPEIKVLLELIKTSNTEVYNHSIRVTDIVENMLNHTDEFDEEKCDEIIKGSLLHDIGKIFIPLNLTNYPYRFCNEEYEIIKTHCCISWKIVHTVFSKTVQDICLYHHEKPNGTGYVESLNLYKLPKEVFLVQVADIYEALTAERTYKKGYMSEYALNIIDGMTRRLEIDDTYVQLLVDYLSETENQEENSL